MRSTLKYNLSQDIDFFVVWTVLRGETISRLMWKKVKNAGQNVNMVSLRCDLVGNISVLSSLLNPLLIVSHAATLGRSKASLVPFKGPLFTSLFGEFPRLPYPWTSTLRSPPLCVSDPFLCHRVLVVLTG